jgi:hypothetical protein
MTGGAMTASGAGFLHALPNKHLQKPFDVETLRSTIQGLLAASTPSGAPTEN